MKKKDIKDISKELESKRPKWFMMGNTKEWNYLEIYYCGELVCLLNSKPFGTNLIGEILGGKE
jgi:hypothetical protein